MFLDESTRIELAAYGPRKISFRIQTTGATVIAENGDDRVILFAGAGKAKVSGFITGPSLFVSLSKGNVAHLDIPELRENEAGWMDGPCFTDLNPKPRGTVSPEIQAIMDAMNRNAIIREQAMLRALGRAQEK